MAEGGIPGTQSGVIGGLVNLVWDVGKDILGAYGHEFTDLARPTVKEVLTTGKNPVNHHLLTASHRALCRAVAVVARDLAVSNDLQTGVWRSLAQHLTSNHTLAGWSPRLRLDQGLPSSSWLGILLATMEEDRFRDWHRRELYDKSDIDQLFQANPNHPLAAPFTRAFLKWVHVGAQLGQANKPPGFDDAFRDQPGGLWLLHGLEFREQLKSDETCFRAAVLWIISRPGASKQALTDADINRIASDLEHKTGAAWAGYASQWQASLDQWRQHLDTQIAALRLEILDAIAGVKDDTTILKDNTATLKEDMAILKEDMATLKDDTTGIKDHTGSLHQSLDKIKRVAEHLFGQDKVVKEPVRNWKLAGAALGLLVVLGGVGLLLGWWEKKDTATTKENTARIEAKIDKLEALQESMHRLFLETQTGQRAGDDTRHTQLFSQLEKKYDLPAGTIPRELPEFGKKLAQDTNAPPYERAKGAYAARDYAEAVRLLTQAAALTDKTRDPREWARIQHSLATIRYDLGQYDQIEPLLRQVISIRAEKFGPEHPATLESRNNLANAINALGRHAEAETEHREVLRLHERILRPNHPSTLASRNNLAIALSGQRKYVEAEAEYRAVLALRRSVLGPEHPDTLGTRNNLANVLQAQGKYADAEAEHRAILRIRERTQGPDHPSTLASRDHLITELKALGKDAEAEAEQRTAIRVRERTLGPTNPIVLVSRNDLAMTLRDQGKANEAEAERRKVLELQERVLGATNEDTITSLYNLAASMKNKGRNQEALDFARRALEGARKGLPPTNSTCKACEKLYAELTAKP